MTITTRIHKELFVASTAAPPATAAAAPVGTPVRLIRMPLTNPRVDNSPYAAKNRRRRLRRQRNRKNKTDARGLAWTADEHERFLRGLELFPRGPWKEVAEFVGTRSVRQTMTHAQKYRQKIARHQRGLHPSSAKKMMTLAASANALSGGASLMKDDLAQTCQTPNSLKGVAAMKSETELPLVNSPGSVFNFPFCTRSTTESWENEQVSAPSESDEDSSTQENLDSLLDDTLLDDLMADEAIDALISQCLTEAPHFPPTVATWGLPDTHLAYECAL